MRFQELDMNHDILLLNTTLLYCNDNLAISRDGKCIPFRQLFFSELDERQCEMSTRIMHF